uniref:Uncharacterized protein n=1 Tax=Cyclopterus lumpus TaxID=8103 RepID=A0A8C3G8Q0_CYCLU
RYHINRFGEGCKLLVFHGLQSPADQDKFFKMMSHAQGARMDEQRCSLQPSRSTPATPKHNGSALNSGRRLDDQRVALPTLPGITKFPSTGDVFINIYIFFKDTCFYKFI